MKENSLNFLLEPTAADSPVISIGAFSIQNTKSQFIDLNKEVKSSINTNKTNKIISENFTNDADAIRITSIDKRAAEKKLILDLKTIKNLFEFLNNFLNSAKLYENFDSFSNCKVDFEKIVENGQEVISLVSKFDIKNLDPQKITEILQDFSNLFHFTSNAVLKCQNIKNDFYDLDKKIKEYFANEDLKVKLVGSLIMNEHLIRQKITVITEQCANGDYARCGDSTGELFALVFYVL